MPALKGRYAPRADANKVTGWRRKPDVALESWLEALVEQGRATRYKRSNRWRVTVL